MDLAERGDLEPYAAVVLAGGGGARLGGVDKAGLRRDGTTLLDRLLHELADAHEVVVVGPERPTSRTVTWTREDPPGGGPAAGVLAGVDALAGGVDADAPLATAAPLVLLVAVDMAWVDHATVERLRSTTTRQASADGAVLLGPDGRRQLCVLARVKALRRARPAGPADGLALHRLLASLDLVEVPAHGEEGADVDTPADLARLHGDDPVLARPTPDAD